MASMLPAWALVPNKTFSTGQTLQDFITFAQLQAELDGRIWQHTSVELPPVLRDEFYVPKNRAPGLIAAFTVLTALAFALVFLRIYSRLKITPKRLVIEDYTLFFGAFLVGVQAVIYIYGLVKVQWGMEVYDLTWKSFQMTNKLTVAQFYITVIGRYTIRISTILFIRRLYNGSGSRMIKFCDYMILANLFFLAATLFILTFHCGARGIKRAMWDVSTQAHEHITCHTVEAVWSGNSIDMLCDTLAILLPLRVAYNMFSAPFWKRVKVFALLGLGFTAWGAAVWRFMTAAEYVRDGKLKSVLDGFVANHVECVLALGCACLPAIQGLIAAVFFGKSTDAPNVPAAIFKASDVEKANGEAQVQIDAITNPLAAVEQQKQQQKKKSGGWGARFGMSEGSLFSTRHTATVDMNTQRRPSVATVATARRPSVPMLEGIPIEEPDSGSDSEKEKHSKSRKRSEGLNETQ